MTHYELRTQHMTSMVEGTLQRSIFDLLKASYFFHPFASVAQSKLRKCIQND